MENHITNNSPQSPSDIVQQMRNRVLPREAVPVESDDVDGDV